MEELLLPYCNIPQQSIHHSIFIAYPLHIIHKQHSPLLTMLLQATKSYLSHCVYRLKISTDYSHLSHISKVILRLQALGSSAKGKSSIHIEPAHLTNMSCKSHSISFFRAGQIGYELVRATYRTERNWRENKIWLFWLLLMNNWKS